MQWECCGNCCLDKELPKGHTEWHSKASPEMPQFIRRNQLIWWSMLATLALRRLRWEDCRVLSLFGLYSKTMFL